MTSADLEIPIQTRRVRTRGYETDVTRTVPLPVYLSYLEHVRWETMQYAPLGLQPALAAGHYFIVRGQVCELVRSLGLGQDLELRCALERVGRSSVWVLHDVIRPADGALVARARVHGVWMGPDRRPARIPDAMRAFAERHPQAPGVLLDTVDAAPAPSPAPPGESASFVRPPERHYPPRGLELEPPELASDARVAKYRLVVRPSDIDVFGHVNAATWVRFCDDARLVAGRNGALRNAQLERLAQGQSVRISIIYLREAREGDALTVRFAALPEASEPARGAFAFQVFRGGEPEPLCRARIETVPLDAP